MHHRLILPPRAGPLQSAWQQALFFCPLSGAGLSSMRIASPCPSWRQ